MLAQLSLDRLGSERMNLLLLDLVAKSRWLLYRVGAPGLSLADARVESYLESRST